MSQTIFKDGTLYAKNKLKMINKCLLAIGEVPLKNGTLVDQLQLGTDAEIAKRMVEDTMVEVQSIGWYFNLDYDYKLYKDVNNFIVLPPNILRVDTIYSNRYVEKNGKLYDSQKFTYKIEPKYVVADVIWLVDYEDLPPEAFEYIAARASRKFQEFVVGAPDLTNVTSFEEQDSYMRMQRRQLQNRAYNIQNSRVSTRVHSGYLQKGLYGNKNRR